MSIRGMEYFLEDTFQELGASYNRLTIAHRYKIGHPSNEVIISYGINGNNEEEYKLYTGNGKHTTVTNSKDVLYLALEHVLKAYSIDKNYSAYLEGV
ncbi:hypothetical protein Spock_271 [Bacillus phage Spock]|uniref:Uncharacterized protein n=2 Tax=Bequatrovirus spock TaxID=1918008 RepID=A0A1X9SGP5_9CAUD|nr:hypothetical protein Spock_271 [Bacillus phage Spock]AGY48671.1 hypothetical protein Spock_271 [Bacillus phage Spock]ARQ95190.1 hypothetical protein FLAPJACK_277 [Bacillus phage Flapjack]